MQYKSKPEMPHRNRKSIRRSGKISPPPPTNFHSLIQSCKALLCLPPSGSCLSWFYGSIRSPFFASRRAAVLADKTEARIIDAPESTTYCCDVWGVWEGTPGFGKERVLVRVRCTSPPPDRRPAKKAQSDAVMHTGCKKHGNGRHPLARHPFLCLSEKVQASYTSWPGSFCLTFAGKAASNCSAACSSTK